MGASLYHSTFGGIAGPKVEWYSDAPMDFTFFCPKNRFYPALGLLALAGLACSSAPPVPLEVKGNFQDAQRLYDQGKPEEAEKVLLAVKTKNPSDAKAHFLLGRIYKETKRPDQAVEEIQ